MFKQLAAEQAVNVIKFEWLKRHAVKERSRRFKFEFFSDLVEGVLKSEEEISHRAKKYTALQHPPYCIVAARIDLLDGEKLPSDSEGATRYAVRELIYDRIKTQMEHSTYPYVRFIKNETFCILIGAKRHTPQLAEIKEQLRELQHDLFIRRNISLSFGIGTPVDSIVHLSQSYKEALDALKAGYQKHAQRFVESYKAKQTEDLLRYLPIDVIESYYTSTFNQLLKTDDKERAELQKTVQTYLEHQSSISATSKKMFIHRNTVIYRLQKYERLTGRSLQDPSDTLRIRLALIMEAFLGQARSQNRSPQA
ncbi:helix-turn-helix domain-containing protein [Paenibacillus sp. TRM 82003]|nr:helix-turn-helix domain-containing protein [Paenibacillus sp. TRM 82003]